MSILFLKGEKIRVRDVPGHAGMKLGFAQVFRPSSVGERFVTSTPFSRAETAVKMRARVEE
jgi:hypothetical protein